MSKRTTIAFVALVVGLTGCERAPEASTNQTTQTDGPPRVYVTFHPTEYWTQRIAGDLVEVVNPLPADADPATWQPGDDVLRRYQAARLIIVNGAEFEDWLVTATLPEARVINTAAGFSEQFLTIEAAHTHSHGDAGEHTHEGVDGHTWLDPQNAITQAAAIRDALVAAFPDDATTLEANYAALKADLENLHQRLERVSERIGDTQLIANHPAWNYLAARYDWNLETFYLEPDDETDPDEIAKLAAFLADHPAEILLWESQPAPAIEQRFRERFDLEPLVYAPGEALDPAQRAAGDNFLTIMNANVDRLEQAFPAP